MPRHREKRRDTGRVVRRLQAGAVATGIGPVSGSGGV